MSFIYSIFGFILRLCYQLCNNNFIIALIVFTLIAKLLMLPMGISQQKSSAKMAQMKPEMDEIKRKYGTNQEKYSQELQKLYQKYDYKMTAGCLPLLIQLPIIMGLFGVIYYPMTYVLNMKAADIIVKAQSVLPTMTSGTDAYKLVETVTQTEVGKYSAENTARGAEIIIAKAAELMDFDLFGFIDLSQTPSLDTFSWLWLIPLASGLSAMLSGYISMKLSGQEINGMSKGMIFGMPIMSVAIAFSLPATIGFYWTISSLLQIGQSFLTKKLYSPEREMKRIEKRKEKERQEKLDRLRRLHYDDDETPVVTEKKAIDDKKPVIKDDPRSRKADVEEIKEEAPELSKKQLKELNRKKLSVSRGSDKK